MDQLLKDEEYIVTSEDRSKITAPELVSIFRRAAVKEGFRITPVAVGGGKLNYASFKVEEDVPFSKMTEILAVAAQMTGTKIYISASEDLLGSNLKKAAEPSQAVRTNAFLMGAPSGYAGKP